MLRFDEGEDIFFDSADYLSSEESIVVEGDLLPGNLGYEIWLKEPRSVKERRESFLREMGFVGLAHSVGNESEMMRLERIGECSGSVSNCCASLVDGVEENLACNGSEMNGEANCAVDELEQYQVNNPNLAIDGEISCGLPPVQPFVQVGAESHAKEHKNFDPDKKKLRSLWKHFLNMSKGTRVTNIRRVSKPIAGTPKVNRMNVQQNKKRCIELTAVYVGQEILAHEGFIWSMKFSPDGQYLASGGEDGVIQIWRVMQVDASCKSLYATSKFGGQGKGGKASSGMKKSSHPSVVIPDKIFQIEEVPLHEFHGHTSDVLDLAWSKSNCLLSSSKDKTVRLWQVGCNECLCVFQHIDYVTCIQFNPTDENYFISGSIDGKVRIWGVSERRVVDWADVRDVVTAICYHPDGKGFIVGSITGTCSFYGTSDGGNIQLNAQIHFQGRKKSSSNKITGIQFTHKDSQRIMITSEDSKVRILDGIDVVLKYRGLAKSGSQMSASFTSTGRHIISVGEDSRVYIWNYDELCVPSLKRANSIRSCEHFFFDGVSLAIPWSSVESKQKGLDSGNLECCLELQDQDQQKNSSWKRGRGRGSGCFSLANRFSMDGSCRGSATWPEEKLPSGDVPIGEHDNLPHSNHELHQHHNGHDHPEALSATWGLVIVTAGWDGMIRTFHNFGLPSRCRTSTISPWHTSEGNKS